MLLKIKANRQQTYSKYLSIVGVVLTLSGLKSFTETESKVLAEFLAIEHELKNNNMIDMLFSTPIRDRVAKTLGMTRSNLTNYISYLADKKAIQTREGSKVLFINPNLIPKTKEDGTIELTFIITPEQ